MQQTITLIATVFNEEEHIKSFLDSVLSQTQFPSEVLITDGGSGDRTIEIISSYIPAFRKKKIRLTIMEKLGNRSVGRNYAIQNAKGDIILCSDAGCRLDSEWVSSITKPFHKNNIDVVAGYYKGIAETVFQKCLIPYVLVMEDKVDPDRFLPATRSVAFTKKIWKSVKGFGEEYSHNEDYVFAKKLKSLGAKIVFTKDAVVYWYPRSTFRESFIMFFRFAYGDAEAGLFRPKVIFLLLRYLIGLILLTIALFLHNVSLILILSIIFFLYTLWAIQKNYLYVKEWQAIFILPLLQLTADIAVLSGTISGIMKVWGILKMP